MSLEGAAAAWLVDGILLGVRQLQVRLESMVRSYSREIQYTDKGLTSIKCNQSHYNIMKEKMRSLLILHPSGLSFMFCNARMTLA